MKVKVGKGKPTCVELTALLGVTVREMVTHADGTTELDISATSLTTGQKTSLEKRFGVEIATE